MAAPFQDNIVLPRSEFPLPLEYTALGIPRECTCGTTYYSTQRRNGMFLALFGLGDHHEVVWWFSKN